MRCDVTVSGIPKSSWNLVRFLMLVIPDDYGFYIRIMIDKFTKEDIYFITALYGRVYRRIIKAGQDEKNTGNNI